VLKAAAEAVDIGAREALERKVNEWIELYVDGIDHPTPHVPDANDLEEYIRSVVKPAHKDHAAPLTGTQRRTMQMLLRATGALMDSRSLLPPDLPSAAQFAIILLSRKRRDDVLNDLWDWYPAWIKKHHGRRVWANFACFVKIAAAFLGQGLDVLYRVREVVGKFRGAR
jgi:hypothetical protein